MTLSKFPPASDGLSKIPGALPGADAVGTLKACDKLGAESLDLSKCAGNGRPGPVIGDTASGAAAEAQSESPGRWPNLAPAHGSYYHKITSAYGQFVGISATVKLGQPHEDPGRISGPLKKPLDGFGAYLGGNVFGKHEVDAGLTWSITKDANGKVDYKDRAWRPFWRDKNWHNGPAQSRYYWQPGDTVNISLSEAGAGKLKLSIADAGPHPSRSFSAVFDASGFDPQSLAAFKRVDSIDQVHREGKSVLPTRASLIGVDWLSTSILSRDASGQTVRTALQAANRKVIEPLPYHVFARADQEEKDRGGERVDIYGRRPTPEQQPKT